MNNNIIHGAMEEKICEIINDEYCCDIDITVDEWKELLSNEDIFNEKSIEAIKKWYIEPKHSATCGYIGKKYNEHSMSANGVINGLGGRVQKELGRFVVRGIGNLAAGIRFITVMKSKQIDTTPKTWEWTIRDELVQAIEELNVFSMKENPPEDAIINLFSDDELVSDIANCEILDSSSKFSYCGK